MVLKDGAAVAPLVDVKLVVLRRFATDSQALPRLITQSADGRAAEVESLLEEPQDPDLLDARGFTALMHASVQGHVEVVRLLLEAMAKPNKRNRDGATALFHASRRGQDEAVRLLLEARADVNVKNNDGETALMNAACRGNAESTRLLLEARANMNEVAKNGATALICTWVSRDMRSAQVLLEAQVDTRGAVGFMAWVFTAMLVILVLDAVFIYLMFAPGSSLQHVTWAVCSCLCTGFVSLVFWTLRGSRESWVAYAAVTDAVRRICRDLGTAYQCSHMRARQPLLADHQAGAPLRSRASSESVELMAHEVAETASNLGVSEK